MAYFRRMASLLQSQLPLESGSMNLLPWNPSHCGKPKGDLISAVSFSPNGQWIATINWNGIIKIRETETQRCTRYNTRIALSVTPLLFSSDSQYLDCIRQWLPTAVPLMYGMQRPAGMSQAFSKVEHPRRKENRHLPGFLVHFST